MIVAGVDTVVGTRYENMSNINAEENYETMVLTSVGCMNGVIPLITACANGADEEIKRLLDAHKGRVNQAWMGGWSPLHVAVVSGFYKAEASEGSVKCTSLLLERGHWPAYRNDQGLTPLHLLCLHGCYNGDLEGEFSKEGETATYLRRKEMNTRTMQDLAKLLLDAGGRGIMDAADSCGWTPLDAAVWANNSIMCELLLGAGANISSAKTLMAKSFVLNSKKTDTGHNSTTSAVLSPRAWRRKRMHSLSGLQRKGRKEKESSLRHTSTPIPYWVSCDSLLDASHPDNGNPAMFEASKQFGLAITVLTKST